MKKIIIFIIISLGISFIISQYTGVPNIKPPIPADIDESLLTWAIINAATKELFKIIKKPEDMIKMGEQKLKSYIKTIGLYNSKAKNIINLSKILIEYYKNKIPSDFKSLTNLPGVGNKTASVFQNEILNIPRIAVDTHVFRVSNRIGLVATNNPDESLEKLERITPK